MQKYDYTKKNIIQSLLEVGVTKRDNLFIHSNLGFFGRLEGVYDKENLCQIFKESILEIIGNDGTIVVPTFSYSFCNREVFDKAKTVSVCGIFSEYIRQIPEAHRSDDANFSVSAIGKNAEYLTRESPQHSFGKNSFWERFLNIDGKICNFNLDSGSTFIHYVEKILSVPYRYDKLFKGESIINEKRIEKSFYHFVYDLHKHSNEPDFTKFDKKAKELGLSHMSRLGRGQIVCITARDVFNLISNEIQKHPNFLIKG